MSAEQDKDSIPLKRGRGGDSGLDGLGGPGVQLGSPDKKKRKANAQGPAFPPLSEYAPPPNPNADHLVAANPFDDNYPTLSYRPPAPSSPYLGPGYPGFGGYGTFRMPPHGPPRLSSPYCGPYPLRGQPHPFPQNPLGVGFGRPHAFNFGPHDSSGLGTPAYSAVLAPGQHFRQGPADGFGPLPPQSAGQAPNPDGAPTFVPGGHSTFSSALEPDHSFIPPPNALGSGKVPPPRQDSSPGAGKGAESTAQARPGGPGGPSAKGPKGAGAGGGAGHEDGEGGRDGGLDGGLDRGLDRTLDGTLDRTLDGSMDRTLDGSMDRTLDGGLDSSLDRTMDRTLDGSMDRGLDRSLDRTLDRSLDGTLDGPARRPAAPLCPCGLCAREVGDDQDAVLCEAACQRWFHRVCAGMTKAAYGLLTAEAAAVWGCDACVAGAGVQLTRAGDA